VLLKIGLVLQLCTAIAFDMQMKPQAELITTLDWLNHSEVVIEDTGTSKLFIALVLCLHEFAGRSICCPNLKIMVLLVCLLD